MMQRFVTQPGEITLAVGHAFEDRRHRMGFGVFRQPDTGGGRQPSGMVIQVFSISRTVRGRCR